MQVGAPAPGSAKGARTAKEPFISPPFHSQDWSVTRFDAAAAASVFPVKRIATPSSALESVPVDDVFPNTSYLYWNKAASERTELQWSTETTKVHNAQISRYIEINFGFTDMTTDAPGGNPVGSAARKAAEWLIPKFESPGFAGNLSPGPVQWVSHSDEKQQEDKWNEHLEEAQKVLDALWGGEEAKPTVEALYSWEHSPFDFNTIEASKARFVKAMKKHDLNLMVPEEHNPLGTKAAKDALLAMVQRPPSAVQEWKFDVKLDSLVPIDWASADLPGQEQIQALRMRIKEVNISKVLQQAYLYTYFGTTNERQRYTQGLLQALAGQDESEEDESEAQTASRFSFDHEASRVVPQFHEKWGYLQVGESKQPNTEAAAYKAFPGRPGAASKAASSYEAWLQRKLSAVDSLFDPDALKTCIGKYLNKQSESEARLRVGEAEKSYFKNMKSLATKALKDEETIRFLRGERVYDALTADDKAKLKEKYVDSGHVPRTEEFKALLALDADGRARHRSEKDERSAATRLIGLYGGLSFAEKMNADMVARSSHKWPTEQSINEKYEGLKRKSTEQHAPAANIGNEKRLELELEALSSYPKFATFREMENLVAPYREFDQPRDALYTSIDDMQGRLDDEVLFRLPIVQNTQKKWYTASLKVSLGKLFQSEYVVHGERKRQQEEDEQQQRDAAWNEMELEEKKGAVEKNYLAMHEKYTKALQSAQQKIFDGIPAGLLVPSIEQQALADYAVEKVKKHLWPVIDQFEKTRTKRAIDLLDADTAMEATEVLLAIPLQTFTDKTAWLKSVLVAAGVDKETLEANMRNFEVDEARKVYRRRRDILLTEIDADPSNVQKQRALEDIEKNEEERKFRQEFPHQSTVAIASVFNAVYDLDNAILSVNTMLMTATSLQIEIPPGIDGLMPKDANGKIQSAVALLGEQHRSAYEEFAAEKTKRKDAARRAFDKRAEEKRATLQEAMKKQEADMAAESNMQAPNARLDKGEAIYEYLEGNGEALTAEQAAVEQMLLDVSSWEFLLQLAKDKAGESFELPVRPKNEDLKVYATNKTADIGSAVSNSAWIQDLVNAFKTDNNSFDAPKVSELVRWYQTVYAPKQAEAAAESSMDTIVAVSITRGASRNEDGVPIDEAGVTRSDATGEWQGDLVDIVTLPKCTVDGAAFEHCAPSQHAHSAELAAQGSLNKLRGHRGGRNTRDHGCALPAFAAQLQLRSCC